MVVCVCVGGGEGGGGMRGRGGGTGRFRSNDGGVRSRPESTVTKPEKFQLEPRKTVKC